MSDSSLMLHCGAREVPRAELAQYPAPPATRSWHPVSHSAFVDCVESTLSAAGFAIQKARYALNKTNQRVFVVYDLQTAVSTGVNLAVAARSSTDMSFPFGLVGGSRVFCCDNLALRSDLIQVKRKHTVNGERRFQEGISLAIAGIEQFRAAEAARIGYFRQAEIDAVSAESFILRAAYDRKIISHRLVPAVLKEWRVPTFEEFAEDGLTLWRLFNAFTTALGPKAKTLPQQHARATMLLHDLLGPTAPTLGYDLPLDLCPLPGSAANPLDIGSPEPNAAEVG